VADFDEDGAFGHFDITGGEADRPHFRWTTTLAAEKRLWHRPIVRFSKWKTRGGSSEMGWVR
jgi:hypothetical protein